MQGMFDTKKNTRFERRVSGAVLLTVFADEAKTKVIHQVEIPGHDWCKLVAQVSLYDASGLALNLAKILHEGSA
jgi:hypothetical protein